MIYMLPQLRGKSTGGTCQADPAAPAPLRDFRWLQLPCTSPRTGLQWAPSVMMVRGASPILVQQEPHIVMMDGLQYHLVFQGGNMLKKSTSININPDEIVGNCSQ